MSIVGVTAACTLVAGLAFAHGGDEPPPPPYLAGPAIAAADVTPQRPGQTLPLAPARKLEFDTDEATWLSPDLSPDGGTIVFDVLGDVYAVPSTGGEARRLTSGLGFDTQPTYSPDGTLVAFVSDRSGADNLWVMRADGSDARQLTFRDDYDPFVTPAWAADGRSIYVTRHRSDINQYELWHVPLHGGEPVLAMPVRESPDAAPETYRSVSGPFASRDGRHLYYARHVGSLSHDELPEWTIVRRDLRTNADEVLVSAPRSPRPDLSLGTAFRPVVSPDGRLLVYGARRDGRTGLRALDLETRVDRWLAYPVQQDQLESLASQDLLPRYAFTPDGRAIVLGIDGKLQRIDVATGDATPIPFRARVSLDVGPQLRVPVKEDTGPVRARLVQSPAMSPDGRRVAFSALGRLYVMDLRRGAKPRRVTNVEDGEFQPSWSPDGRSLVYASWNAREAGHVWTVPASGGAAPTRVTDVAAFYTSPVYAPDGGSIVVLRSSHSVRMHSYMEYGSLRDAELVVLQRVLPADGTDSERRGSAAGGLQSLRSGSATSDAGSQQRSAPASDLRTADRGPARVVTRALLGGRPRFARTPDGTGAEVYVNSSSGVDAISLADGTRRRVVSAVGPGWYFAEGLASADLIDVSPDGRWALAQIAQQLHLFAVPGPDAPPVDLTRPAVAHRKLTDVGADFFEWSADGRSIVWAVGSTVHRRTLASVQPARAEPPARSRDAERFDVRVDVPRDTPRGAIVLRGATAITMRGDETIADADVVVVDGRIAAIGPRGSVPVPRDARVEDVRGRWIVPGFIDSHDHLADVRRVLLDDESWGPAATLAYGVTTTFDPSSLTIDMFAYGDLVDAGRMLGPRIRTTGPAVFSFNRFESLDEVRAVLTRYVEHYRTRNLKVYRTGNRRVRQWLAQACRELGIVPTTEGALSLKLDLTQIIDGFAGSEHSLPAVPLKRDVLELLARMRTSYTLTLQIANGGPAAQDDFVARERPHDDPKLNRFYPHYVLDIRTLNRRWRDPREYLYPRLAASARDVVHAGGLVAIGTHGEMPGLGFHWEMEAHVAGGWTPHEALRAGTMGSAEAIGRHTEFGSLEPGKYADLVVLDRDPLADIRNARAVRFVMKDGRLYAADTLEELWPRRRTFGPRWFAQPGR